MSEQNKEVALRFITAMGSNDPVTAETCLAPDAISVARGTSVASGERTRQQIVEGIEAFKTLMPTGLSLDIRKVIGEGDTVMVECKGNAVTADGTPYENEYCFVVTLQDGKIKQFAEYFDTAMAEKALWPLVQKMGVLQLNES